MIYEEVISGCDDEEIILENGTIIRVDRGCGGSLGTLTSS